MYNLKRSKIRWNIYPSITRWGSAQFDYVKIVVIWTVYPRFQSFTCEHKSSYGLEINLGHLTFI